MNNHASGKRLSRFEELERSVIRDSQIFKAHKKADDLAIQKRIALQWDMTDERLPIIVYLADSLMDYLNWPDDQWSQSPKGDLEFFISAGVLRMKLDLRLAGIALVDSSLGVAVASASGWNVYLDQILVSRVSPERPETLADFHQKAAKWIKNEATKIVLGQPR